MVRDTARMLNNDGPVRPRVVLIGPPGSGKTTVGRVLAELLGVELRDTDQVIEVTTGTVDLGHLH